MLRFLTAILGLSSLLILSACGEEAPADSSTAEEPKGSTNPAASMMQRKADEMTEEQGN